MKGEADLIYTGQQILSCTGGSPRRCGGQGDILAGVTSLFSYYAQLALIKNFSSQLESSKKEKIIIDKELFEISRDDIVDSALFVSSEVVKNAAFLAYSSHARSTTAIQIINSLENSFKLVYQPHKDSGSSKL